MSYTVEDFNEINDKINQKLTELEHTNQDNKKSILQLCREIVELERIKLNHDKLSIEHKSHFASYIIGKVNQRVENFQTSGSFFALFQDDEKILRGTNNQAKLSHEHAFEQDERNPDVKKCICGKFYLGKLTCDVVEWQESKPKDDEVKTPKKEQKDPYQNECTEYLQRLKYNLQEFANQCDDLVGKYFADETFAKAIESALTNVKNLVTEQKSVEARLIKTRKQSDFRNKIGEFEKLKMIMLWRAGHVHSHIAKVLKITPKHMSHNILKNREGYIKTLEWFGTVELKCDNCDNKNTYSLSDWYEEQVARKSLDLPMEQPLLNT